MNSALIALAGVIVGIIAASLIHRKDRKDKYLFALIEKRFKVAQEAYQLSKQLSLKLKSIIGDEEKITNDIIPSARKWFDENCLYLLPTIRNDLDDIINKVGSYKDILKLHGKCEINTEKEKIIYDRLDEDFKKIITLKNRIENSMNPYYKIIGK